MQQLMEDHTPPITFTTFKGRFILNGLEQEMVASLGISPRRAEQLRNTNMSKSKELSLVGETTIERRNEDKCPDSLHKDPT
jgi:hypothetical protein